MFVAADYPFLDLFWTMVIIVAWVLWIWMVIAVLTDIFRRKRMGGVKKAVWVLIILFLPLIGILVYLIMNGDGMAERYVRHQQETRSVTDDYVRTVSATSEPAAEIERAKGLLDSGAITSAEFDAIKTRALGTA